MNRLELFNNLVVMAAVDGKITDEEASHLAQRATHWGITEAEASSAIQNATSGERNFAVPQGKDERLDVLREIIGMMAIDGELAGIEKNLCVSAAMAMKISKDELREVLASTT